MMNDRYDQDMLLGYIEGELTPEEAAAFEQRLAADEPLRRLVEKLQADRAALRGLPSEPVPYDLVDDATQQLEREMLLGPTSVNAAASDAAPARTRRRIHWVKPVTYTALAAAVALCAGVIIIALTDTGLLQEATRFAQSQDAPRSEDERAPEAATPLAEPLAQRDAVDREGEGEGVGADADAEMSAPLALRSMQPPAMEMEPQEPQELQAPHELAEALEEVEALADAQAPEVDALARADETVPPMTPSDSLLERVRRAAEAVDGPTRELAAAPESATDEAVDAPADEEPAIALGLAHEIEAEAETVPMRLEVTTSSTAQTRRELFEWAHNNQAAVAFEPQQTTLRLRADQVDALVVHLNRAPERQQVTFAPSAVSMRTAGTSAYTRTPLTSTAPDPRTRMRLESTLRSEDARETADLSGEPTVIERQSREGSVTLSLSDFWTQRDRLMRALNDALIAHAAQQQPDEAIAAAEDEESSPAEDVESTVAVALPLDWRQQLARQFAPTVDAEVAAEPFTAPEPRAAPTVELAVVIHEQPPSSPLEADDADDGQEPSSP